MFVCRLDVLWRRKCFDSVSPSKAPDVCRRRNTAVVEAGEHRIAWNLEYFIQNINNYSHRFSICVCHHWQKQAQLYFLQPRDRLSWGGQTSHMLIHPEDVRLSVCLLGLVINKLIKQIQFICAAHFIQRQFNMLQHIKECLACPTFTTCTFNLSAVTNVCFFFLF